MSAKAFNIRPVVAIDSVQIQNFIIHYTYKGKEKTTMLSGKGHNILCDVNTPITISISIKNISNKKARILPWIVVYKRNSDEVLFESSHKNSADELDLLVLPAGKATVISFPTLKIPDFSLTAEVRIYPDEVLSLGLE